MKHTLAINIDEIATNIMDAVPFLEENQISAIELRTLNGKNIANLDENEVKIEKKKITDNNLKVCALASPLFKWYKQIPSKIQNYDSFSFPCILTDDEKRQAINQTIRNSKLFDADKIRVFSGLNAGNPDISSILSDPLLLDTIEEGKKNGVKILLENEPVCHAFKLDDIKKILTKFSHLNLWLDVANFYQVHETITLDDLEELLPFIHHVHLKDFVFENGNKVYYVPLGQGCIPWKKILSFLRDKAFHNISMSIETHVKMDKLKATKQSIKFYQQVMQS